MKKFLALALAAIMLLGMMSFASAEDPAWEPFAENVTITIPVYDRGQAGVPNVEENYWTKWIQENFGDKYNLTVKYVAIPPYRRDDQIFHAGSGRRSAHRADGIRLSQGYPVGQ